MMMRVKIQQLALQLVAMAKLHSSPDPDQVFLRWVEIKQNHLANLNQYNQKNTRYALRCSASLGRVRR
jgi:hypothetical protein